MNGSECHSPSGPGGTTSVCPAKQTSGWVSPRRAQRLSTAPKRIGSQRKPYLARRARRRFWQPPSSGVTDRRAMSSLASSSAPADRKSTRLNSSHSQISYAVFCLKKKKKNRLHKLNQRLRKDIILTER